MAIAFVQSKAASGNSGTSLTVSGLTATTAGNLLVALISCANNPGDRTFTPPTSWVQAGTEVQDDIFISLDTAVYYYANNPGGITSATFTASGSTSAWHVTVMEFSGIATSSPLDVTAARQQTGLTPSSGSITTTASGDLLIGWSEIDEVSGAADTTITQPTGYTALTRLNDGGAWLSTFAGYATGGAAGSVNYAPTKSRADSEGVFTLVTFKAAAGGSTVFGNAESDGIGQGTGKTTLYVASQGAGAGTAQAGASLFTVAQSVGKGSAQAAANLFIAAVAAGQGTDQSSATLFAVAMAAGDGQAQADAALFVQALSLGIGGGEAQSSPSLFAVSGGVGSGSAGPVVLYVLATSNGSAEDTATTALRLWSAAVSRGAALDVALIAAGASTQATAIITLFALLVGAIAFTSRPQGSITFASTPTATIELKD